MTKSFTQKGNILTLIAPHDVASGEGALIGSIFGVAQTDVASGAEGEFEVVGCHDLKAASGAGTDWAQGAKLYWDATEKTLTKTATSNTLIGAATAAKIAGATAGNVRLNGTVV